MNKFVTGIIVLALIAGGLWLVMSQGGDQSSQQPAQQAGQQEAAREEESRESKDTNGEVSVPEAAKVTYEDDGFTPETIRVPAGTTVTWTNESGQAMWVASDVHPTHEILPEFDQLGRGDSYSFTFSEAGEWEYHNHLRSSHTGTIIVE